jgi:hypothetical protein
VQIPGPGELEHPDNEEKDNWQDQRKLDQRLSSLPPGRTA